MTEHYDKIADLVATKVAKLEEKLKEKDDVIEDLNTKVSALESKIDDLEQYSRRTSIKIHGLKEEEDLNIEGKVGNVMKSIGVDPAINHVHHITKSLYLCTRASKLLNFFILYDLGPKKTFLLFIVYHLTYSLS